MTNLIVIGDSNSVPHSLPAAQGYGAITALALGRNLVNRAVGGMMAGDATLVAYNNPPASTDIVVAGLVTNDERIYGTSVDRRSAFVHMMRDLALRVVAPNKIGGRDTGMSYTGAWVDLPAYKGRYVDGAGAKATAQVSGSTIYVGFIASSWSAAHSKANVKVDGVLAGEIVTDFNNAGIGTQNNPGAPWSQAAAKFSGFSEGTHTVEIETTVAGQRFYMEYIAGSDQPASPPIYFLSAAKMTAAGYTTYGGSEANIIAYNAALQAMVAELSAEGLNAHYVDIFSSMNPSTHLQADGLHWNTAGHAVVAQAVLDAVNGEPEEPEEPSLTFLPAVVEKGSDGYYYLDRVKKIEVA